MPNQKRQDEDAARKTPDTDPVDESRDAGQPDREPAEGQRFDKERKDRDRSAVESHNQGQGPLNVGDQSRTR
jgi:nucleoid-associated protein YgaU